MKGVRFTPVEQRMIDLLADGMDHTRAELHTCLFDELAPLQAINGHITNIRKKIRHLGHDIVCLPGVGPRPMSYRHVRSLHPPPDRETSHREIEAECRDS